MRSLTCAQLVAKQNAGRDEIIQTLRKCVKLKREIHEALPEFIRDRVSRFTANEKVEIRDLADEGRENCVRAENIAQARLYYDIMRVVCGITIEPLLLSELDSKPTCTATEINRSIEFYTKLGIAIDSGTQNFIKYVKFSRAQKARFKSLLVQGMTAEADRGRPEYVMGYARLYTLVDKRELVPNFSIIEE